MIVKKKLLKSLRDMPEHIPIEDLMDRIILLQKIDNGLQQSANKEIHTTKEAKERLGKWL